MKGFGYLVKEGIKNVWANRIMSIASVCVLVSCLVLTGAATLFSINVSQMVDQVGQNNETTVYVTDGYSDLEVAYVGRALEKLDNITSVTFYSKEDAFQQYKDQLGEELFARIEEINPLPDSYIVVMDDLSKYDETVAEIQSIDGVDSIRDRRAFAEKMTNISNMVNIIAIGVVLVLVIISLFIIANTIRATMYSRRYEISIMKSVGATNAFVRMPFLVEGMVIGLISAAVSVGVLALLYEGIDQVFVQMDIPLTFISFSTLVLYVIGSFVVAGMVVGLLGSSLSIRKYLKMEGNEILGW